MLPCSPWKGLEMVVYLWTVLLCVVLNHGNAEQCSHVKNWGQIVQHLWVCGDFIAALCSSAHCGLWSTLRVCVYNDGNLWSLLAGCCCRISEWECSSAGSSSNQTPPGGRAGQKQWEWALVSRDSTPTLLSDYIPVSGLKAFVDFVPHSYCNWRRL